MRVCGGKKLRGYCWSPARVNNSLFDDDDEYDNIKAE